MSLFSTRFSSLFSLILLAAGSIFTAIPASIEEHRTPELILTVPTSVSQNFGTFIARIAEDAQYDSRGFEASHIFPLGSGVSESDVPTIEIACKAQWGYKGSGDRKKAFTGFPVAYGIEVAYDGFKIDLMRSRAFRSRYKELIDQISHVQPTHEFFFKLAQLFFTAAQRGTLSTEELTSEMAILIERLELTPGHETVLAMPFISSMLTLYKIHPTSAALLLLTQAQKALSFFGVLTAPLPLSFHKFLGQCFMAATLSAEALTIPLPGQTDQTMTINFGYGEIGDISSPLPETIISVERPHSATEIERETYTVSPEVGAILKAVVIVIDGLKRGQAPHAISTTLNNLLLRLGATPVTRAPALFHALTAFAHWYQNVAEFNFSTAPTAPISHGDFLLYISSISYYALLTGTLPSGTPASAQERTQFFSEHCGHAVRQMVLTNHTNAQMREMMTRAASGSENPERARFDIKTFAKALFTLPTAK